MPKKPLLILFLTLLIASPAKTSFSQSNEAETPSEQDSYTDVITAEDPRLNKVDNALEVAVEEHASDVRSKPYETNIPSSTFNEAYTTYDATQTSSTDVKELPDWVKRTWFGLVAQTDQQPKFYFETIQPLYQSPGNEDTVFTQGRASTNGGNEDYSLGIGYRRLVMEDSLMLGINNFFDYTSRNDHYRTGIGLEAITQAWEFRANSYIRLSPKRYVGETQTNRLYERTVNGFDVEFGGPLSFGWLENMGIDIWSPSWLKLFGGYYWYDYRSSEDLQGLKLRGEIKLMQSLVVNLSVFDDNMAPTQYQADLRLNLQVKDFRLKSIIESLKDSTPAEPPALDTRTLERVERNFNIQIERPKERTTLVGGLANVQLVIRFPGVNPTTTDFNSNGRIDPGEDFELDVLMTNNGAEPSTGISYKNAIMDSDPNRIRINNEATLPDAPPGGTTRTDNGTDMDPSFYSTDTPGQQLYITLDFTADGETKTLTFGPFVVGSAHDGQVINVVN